MKCPVCGSEKSFTDFYKNENSAFTNTTETFPMNVVMCDECSFIFMSNAYTDEYDKLIESIYKKFDKNDFFPFPYRSEENLKTRDVIAEKIDPSIHKNLLEIGANRGDMLYLISEELPELNVLGIEPTITENNSMPIIRGYYEEGMFSNKFDIIVMQHVLEHIKNPKNFIQTVKSLMHKDSLFYVEVPDISFSLSRMTEDFMPEHVSYFDENSLVKCMKGFRPVYKNKDTFLRMLFKLDENSIPTIREESNTVVMMREFLKLKDQLIKELRELARGRKIVFYGVSYYFRMIYPEIRDALGDAEYYFTDDNYKEDFEPHFKLGRIGKLDGKCVAVLCSNNAFVQDKMAEKLSGINGLKVLKPWSQIVS